MSNNTVTTPLINFGAYDPSPATSMPALVRTLAGPTKWNPVTFDIPFSRTGVAGDYSRWVYTGETGNINFTQWDGSTVTMTSVNSGVMYWIPATQINSSGTTIDSSALLWGS